MANTDIILHGSKLGKDLGYDLASAAKAKADDVEETNTLILLEIENITTDLNNKENSITAGTTSQYYRGDKTWVDFFTNVRAAILTGLSTATNTAVVVTDSILIAIGKLQAQLNAVATNISDAIISERSSIANLNNKTLVSPVINNYTEAAYTSNVSGNVSINLTNGTLQKLTLTGNTTFTLPNSVIGKSYTLIIGYSGAFVPTFTGGSVLKWSGQSAPPAKSTAGFFDIFVFTCDGINTYGRSGGSNF